MAGPHLENFLVLRSLRICSDKFPGDAEATGSGAALWEPLFYTLTGEIDSILWLTKGPDSIGLKASLSFFAAADVNL